MKMGWFETGRDGIGRRKKSTGTSSNKKGLERVLGVGLGSGINKYLIATTSNKMACNENGVGRDGKGWDGQKKLIVNSYVVE